MEALRNVKLNADMQRKISGNSISFETYRSLLLDYAESHDSENQPNKGRPSGREQRSVFHAATLFDPYASSYDDDVDPDDSAIFDADTDISGLQAYIPVHNDERNPYFHLVRVCLLRDGNFFQKQPSKFGTN